MSSAGSGGPSPTTSDYSTSILPYTKGLTGVNLWLNSITSDALYGTLGLIAILVLVTRCLQVLSAYIRFVSILDSEQQNYWAQDDSTWSRIKKHLLVAPLIRTRHHREFQLSTAMNMGTVPSRLQSLFLGTYVLTNIIYCCILDYHQSHAAILAEARGRTGHLAVVNMVPLFLFATRNDPLIPLLGISFDTFNLIHRWVGRLVIIESIAHTLFWGANNYDALGLHGLTRHLTTDPFLIYGLVSMIAMITILFQSVSAIRHAFYETFLHLHQVLVVAVVTGILLHCENQNLPQKPLIYFIISMWVVERLLRLSRLWFYRKTKARVEALDGGACRVTYSVPGTWPKAPGRHIYVYIPSVSLWMSHPFSVAWVKHKAGKEWLSQTAMRRSQQLDDTEKQEDIQFEYQKDRTTISCIVAARTGMTAELYRHARSKSSGVNITAFIEGPYSCTNVNLGSYGTVVLFAGGVGITHQISQLQYLMSSISAGTCGTRKVVLVWSIRSREALEWVRAWLEELLDMPRRGRKLKILIYISRAASSTTTTNQDNACENPSNGMDRLEQCVHWQRMDVHEVVQSEFRDRVGAMTVGVCGPGRLADEVRSAARSVMGQGKVDFWEESFSW
ncbi:metalloreductase [Xylogone sp. PMI_703]|nr:metalloreductase [Xylogone sp. PMI_703]